LVTVNISVSNKLAVEKGSAPKVIPSKPKVLIPSPILTVGKGFPNGSLSSLTLV